jgi:hypothetical protein
VQTAYEKTLQQQRAQGQWQMNSGRCSWMVLLAMPLMLRLAGKAWQWLQQQQQQLMAVCLTLGAQSSSRTSCRMAAGSPLLLLLQLLRVDRASQYSQTASLLCCEC